MFVCMCVVYINVYVCVNVFMYVVNDKGHVLFST